MRVRYSINVICCYFYLVRTSFSKDKKEDTYLADDFCLNNVGSYFCSCESVAQKVTMEVWLGLF